MIKSKVLISAIVLSVTFAASSVFAEPIVELAAPRVAPKIVSEEGAPLKSTVSETKKDLKATKSKSSSIKKKKKHIKKKPKPIIIDYEKISKLIEYGYYDQADAILNGAIHRNSKDVSAISLKCVSFAKQCKLDPAQDELSELLKKYPNNSNLHYAQGVVYYQRTTSSNMAYRANADKLVSDALCEFKKAIELDKNNARAYNAIGVVSLNQGNTKDAKEYFNKALQADKTYSLAIDNLGTIDFIEGKINDAEKKFKTALQYNTQNTTAMYHLAQIAMKNKDFSAALTHLNNALYLNNNSPAIYNLMGKAYREQGNEAAAINSFNKSLQVKPEFTLSYLDLADIYDKRGDSEFAIEKLKTAITIDPVYYDAKLKLADISMTSGKYQQAVNVYSELVGVDGYNDAALKGLASSYYGLAQTSAQKNIGSSKDAFKALDCIERAISANPNDLELHLAKLKLSKILNLPGESKVALNNIIKSPNSDLMSLVVKGEAYVALDDYDNAKLQFSKAVKLSKTPDEDAYLTEILLYNKQFDSAQFLIDKVLKSDPKNNLALSGVEYIKKSKKKADNYYKSGLIFLKQKNNPTALEYFSRALMLDPNNAQAHLLIAQIYEKNKCEQDALKHYKAYLSLSTNAKNAKSIKNKIKKLENEL